jgi:hypothetical protein
MRFPDRLKKFSAPVLAVISGILLFAAAAAASLDGSIFNSSFHLGLMERYGIYSQLEKTADNALKNYLSEIKSGPSENKVQAEQLFSLIGKAVTADMVRLNTDSIVKGLINYFSGEVRFLPDIYMKPAGENSAQASQNDLQQLSSLPENSLAGIDTISLNGVLLYMDRNDIINALSEVRLFSFVLSYAPVFLVLLSLFLLIPAVMLAMRSKIKACLSLAAAAAGVSGIASACLMLVLSRLYLPEYLSSSPLTEYIQYDALYGYVKSCVQRPAAGIAVFGAALLVIACLVRLLPRHLKFLQKPASNRSFVKMLPHPDCAKFLANHGKALAGGLLALLLAGALLIQAEAMKGDFHLKDLGTSLAILRGKSPYSAVTSARDDTVYSVEVRTVDRQSGAPIQGLEMRLEGKLSDSGKDYSESGTSDESGKTRFDLLKGSFQLEFDRSLFPQAYALPSSYPFEINAAGTTIITVNLEKNEGKKTGIAEILVLGIDNKPLENLELSAEESPVEGEEAASAGKVYSFTNQDGVAVFKLTEGSYKVSFMEPAFPQQYLIPEPIEIEVTGDASANYSLKLAKKKP